MRKSVCLCVSLLFLLLCSNLLSNTQDSESVQIYSNMPIEVHLLIAGIKLDELIQNSESNGETKKVEKFQEAKIFIHEAIRKYEYYRTGDENILSENWGFSWAPPSPDFPSIAKSPMSVLEHLWIGNDAAIQLKFQIMSASVQYSPAQVKFHQSLHDSIDSMEKAIEAVKSTGVWTVHWLSSWRMMISAPPEYKPISPLESELVRLLKSKPDGSPQGLVFVSQRFLVNEEFEMTPEQYQKKQIEKTRQKFPDMANIELGENRTVSGDFTTSFVFTYTWEGDLIKSLVHARRIGDSIFEVSCVSLADSFSRMESDQIIKSFHKLD